MLASNLNAIVDRYSKILDYDWNILRQLCFDKILRICPTLHLLKMYNFVKIQNIFYKNEQL